MRSGRNLCSIEQSFLKPGQQMTYLILTRATSNLYFSSDPICASCGIDQYVLCCSSFTANVHCDQYSGMSTNFFFLRFHQWRQDCPSLGKIARLHSSVLCVILARRKRAYSGRVPLLLPRMGKANPRHQVHRRI